MRSDTTGGDGVADLDELERMLAGATPGKWEAASAARYEGGRPIVTEWFVRVVEDDASLAANFIDPATGAPNAANAAAIVALHNAAPALIAAARREQEARALIAALVEAGQYVFCCNSWPHDGRRPHAPDCAWGKARAWLTTARGNQ